MPLDMTAKAKTATLMTFSASAVFAQESPSPAPSPITEASPEFSISPAEFVTPLPVPEQTPSASPWKSVRVDFLPPPLEGRISLGIYDAKGKLVGVLHQQSDLNEFKIGADWLADQELVIDQAEGVWVWTEQGKKLLDGFAGLAVVNVGHGRREIAEAIAEQTRAARLLPDHAAVLQPARRRAGGQARHARRRATCATRCSR